VDVTLVPDGELILSDLLQVILNQLLVGRLDLACAILPDVIEQLKAAGN
jgi:hypothetical protein